jgi:hypothetical protein
MSINAELHEIIKLVKQNICQNCLVMFKPLDDFMFANGYCITEERVNDFLSMSCLTNTITIHLNILPHQSSDFTNDDTPYPISPDLLHFARSINSVLPKYPSDSQFKHVLLRLFDAKADPGSIIQLIDAYLPVAIANDFEEIHSGLEDLKMRLTCVQDPVSSLVCSHLHSDPYSHIFSLK